MKLRSKLQNQKINPFDFDPENIRGNYYRILKSRIKQFDTEVLKDV